jgi:hypothetical protein
MVKYAGLLFPEDSCICISSRRKAGVSSSEECYRNPTPQRIRSIGREKEVKPAASMISYCIHLLTFYEVDMLSFFL